MVFAEYTDKLYTGLDKPLEGVKETDRGYAQACCVS